MMEDKRDGKNAEEEYFSGELDFYTELFERGTRAGKKRKHPASKLDDVAFLFDPPGEEEEGPEDGSDWPYGEI